MITETQRGALEYYGAIVGKKVASVRLVQPLELEALGWDDINEPAIQIVMTDGTVVLPTRDPEMNGPGFLAIAEGSEL
jgi:hypothetical protein